MNIYIKNCKIFSLEYTVLERHDIFADDNTANVKASWIKKTEKRCQN